MSTPRAVASFCCLAAALVLAVLDVNTLSAVLLALGLAIAAFDLSRQVA